MNIRIKLHNNNFDKMHSLILSKIKQGIKPEISIYLSTEIALLVEKFASIEEYISQIKFFDIQLNISELDISRDEIISILKVMKSLPNLKHLMINLPLKFHCNCSARSAAKLTDTTDLYHIFSEAPRFNVTILCAAYKKDPLRIGYNNMFPGFLYQVSQKEIQDTFPFLSPGRVDFLARLCHKDEITNNFFLSLKKEDINIQEFLITFIRRQADRMLFTNVLILALHELKLVDIELIKQYGLHLIEHVKSPGSWYDVLSVLREQELNEINYVKSCLLRVLEIPEKDIKVRSLMLRKHLFGENRCWSTTFSIQEKKALIEAILSKNFHAHRIKEQVQYFCYLDGKAKNNASLQDTDKNILQFAKEKLITLILNPPELISQTSTNIVIKDSKTIIREDELYSDDDLYSILFEPLNDEVNINTQNSNQMVQGVDATDCKLGGVEHKNDLDDDFKFLLQSLCDDEINVCDSSNEAPQITQARNIKFLPGNEVKVLQSLTEEEIATIPNGSRVLYSSNVNSYTTSALKEKYCSLVNLNVDGVIDNKYHLGDSYALPKNSNTHNKSSIFWPSYTTLMHYEFKSIQSFTLHPYRQNYKGGFKSHLGPLRKTDRCLFIMAGRTENALIPLSIPGEIRVVLVMTHSEYQQHFNPLSKKDNDILIVEEIVSDNYDSQVACITSRRRKAWSFSLENDLQNAMELDDNIKSIEISNELNKHRSITYTEAYDWLYKKSIEVNEPRISVQNKSYKPTYYPKNRFGGKFSFHNFDILKEMIFELDENIDIKKIGFAFWPEDDATCQQDYYLQCVLNCLANMTSNSTNRQGFQRLSKSFIRLHRSNSNKNLARKTNKPLAEIIITPSFEQKLLTAGGEHLLELIKRSTTLYNSIINESKRKYIERQMEFSECDYTKVLSKEFFGFEDDEDFENIIKRSKNNDLYQCLSHAKKIDFLHPHQKNALEFYQHRYATNGDLGFNICTGGGKTFIQGLIAFAHFRAAPTKNVVIVCPTQDVSVQFRDALRDLSSFDWLPDDLFVPINKIHSVLSNTTTGSIPQEHFYNNEALRTKPNILIICHSSYKKLIEHCNSTFNIIESSSIFMFDEAHITAIDRSQSMLPKNKNRLLFTATPRKNLWPSFNFSAEQGMKEGVLSSLMIDNTLPQHLTKDFATIKSIILYGEYVDLHDDSSRPNQFQDYKGVIYVSKKEEVDELASVLSEGNSIPCFKINSDNPKKKEHLEAFKKSKTGVAIAINLLVEGFDDPAVRWGMILRNSLSSLNDDDKRIQDEDKRSQIIGRLLRKFKDQNKTAVLIMPDHFELSEFEERHHYSHKPIDRYTETPYHRTVGCLLSLIKTQSRSRLKKTRIIHQSYQQDLKTDDEMSVSDDQMSETDSTFDSEQEQSIGLKRPSSELDIHSPQKRKVCISSSSLFSNGPGFFLPKNTEIFHDEPRACSMTDR